MVNVIACIAIVLVFVLGAGLVIAVAAANRHRESARDDTTLGPPPPPQPRVVVRSAPHDGDDNKLAQSGRIVVELDRRPMWQLRGWRRQGSKLIGAFRTPRGSFSGEIELGRKDVPTNFIIVNPPPTLLAGSHGACFRPRGNNRFWVHFCRQHGIDSGIQAVESLLVKALS